MPQDVPLPPLQPGPEHRRSLPPGRWSCTRAEFEKVFLRPDRATRQRLIDDLDVFAGQQAKHGLVVSAYWIGGSFVTGKLHPGDIDFTAVIDGTASTPDAGAGDWLNPGKRWQHQVHRDIGRLLLVDAYALVKLPDAHPRNPDYHRLRGQWDDWWQRSRATGEALARGYVEVVDWR